MSKLIYFIAAIIRIVGHYLSRFSTKIKGLLEYMTARSQKGITVRLWMAVAMTVCALLFEAFYLKDEFDRLPAYVPLIFDIDGNVVEWGHKSMLSGYVGLRGGIFIVMALIGWVICRVMGGTLMAQRIRLLFVDVANLLVTTGVSMAYVYIQIAQGSLDEKLEEEVEYAVMGFWLLTLVIEYITDRKPILQSASDPRIS